METKTIWKYSWVKRETPEGKFITLTLDIKDNNTEEIIYILEDTEGEHILEFGKIEFGPHQGCRFCVGEYKNNPRKYGDILL